MNKYISQALASGVKASEAVEHLRELELVVPTAHEHDLITEAIAYFQGRSILPFVNFSAPTNPRFLVGRAA